MTPPTTLPRTHQLANNVFRTNNVTRVFAVVALMLGSTSSFALDDPPPRNVQGSVRTPMSQRPLGSLRFDDSPNYGPVPGGFKIFQGQPAGDMFAFALVPSFFDYEPGDSSAAGRALSLDREARVEFQARFGTVAGEPPLPVVFSAHATVAVPRKNPVSTNQNDSLFINTHFISQKRALCTSDDCTPEDGSPKLDFNMHGLWGDINLVATTEDGVPLKATVSASYPTPDETDSGEFRLTWFAAMDTSFHYSFRKSVMGPNFFSVGPGYPLRGYIDERCEFPWDCETVAIPTANEWGLRVLGDGALRNSPTKADRTIYSNAPGVATWSVKVVVPWLTVDADGNPVVRETTKVIPVEVTSDRTTFRVVTFTKEELEKGNRCDENPCAPHPVDLVTGDVFLDQTDVNVPTLGEPLAFRRSYNSMGSVDGSMGRGWTHSYDLRITETAVSDRILVLHGQGGARLVYTAPSDPSVFRRFGVSDSRERIEKTQSGYVRYIEGGSTQSFSDAGLLLAATDRLGRVTTLAYDEFHRLTSVQAADGRQLVFTYSGSGTLITSVSGPSGRIADYLYATIGFNRQVLSGVDYPDGRGYRFTYDSVGRLLTVADKSGVVSERHGYDALGRAAFSETNGGRERRSFSFEEDRTLVTDANGHTATFEFVQTIAGRRLKKRSNCSFCGTSSGTEEWEYDNQGRPVKHTNSEGAEARYEYTGDNVTKITNALGRETNFDNHDSLGRPGTITEHGFAPRSLTYAPEGPETISQGGRTTTIAYANNRVQSVTSPMGLVYQLSVNDLGEVVAVTDPRGKARTMAYNTLGQVVSVTEADGKTTSFVRDARGRVTAERRPDGKSRRYSFNPAGRIERVTDETGRASRYVYDAFGRVAQVIDPAGLSTLFEYDLMSNVLSLRDAKGQRTQYEYDVMNRVTAVIDPMGGRVTFEYWPTGRLKKRIDRRSIATNYAYDAIGRLVSRTHSDGTPGLSVVYNDDARTVTAANVADTLTWSFDVVGQLSSEASTRNAATLTYAYDLDGRRTGLSLNGAVFSEYQYTQDLLSRIVRGTKVWEFGYDDVGQRTSMSLPNGLTTSYSYDPNLRWLNEIKVLNASSTEIMKASYTHDEVGNRLTKSLLEGTETYSYDTLDRLTKSSSSSGEQGWAYDEVGNRTMSEASGIAQDARHDARNRLLDSGLTGTLRVSGETDEASTVSVNGETATLLEGNRFEKRVPFSGTGGQTITVQATDGSGNARTSTYAVDPAAEASTYSHDADGHLTQNVSGTDTWAYSWNALGELVSVSKNSQPVASFEYDPAGRRVSKVTPTTTTSWLLDGMDILRETTTGANSETAYFVHGPGIDEPLGREVSGAMTYYHADGLGSILKITDQSGAVVHEYRYDAWGNIQAGANRGGFAFTGREWDPETGLYYYRARYYDPKAGRFISEDPIGFAGGLNLATYVGNNPAGFVDPFGWQASSSGPNVNLFSGTINKDFDAFANASTLVHPGPGELVINGHSMISDGKVIGFQDGRTKDGSYIDQYDPADLWKIVQESDLYKKKKLKKITLNICQAGNSSPWLDEFLDMANGVPVSGPTHNLKWVPDWRANAPPFVRETPKGYTKPTFVPLRKTTGTPK